MSECYVLFTISFVGVVFNFVKTPNWFSIGVCTGLVLFSFVCMLILENRLYKRIESLEKRIKKMEREGK